MTFHYYNQDHLGNNLELVNENGIIEQVTNYYPFGAPYCDNTNTNADLQPYKYNGKELDLTHGLNTYDYGARQYNSIVPSWTSVDPLAEKYYNISPYVYCGNNPVNIIDPNGMEWVTDSAGNAHWDANYTKDNVPEGMTYLGATCLMMDNFKPEVFKGNSDGSETFLYKCGDPANTPTQSTLFGYCGGQPDPKTALTFRDVIPDVVTLGVGFSGIAGVGGASSVELNWITRGTDASLKPYMTVTEQIGTGYSIDVTLNIGESYYLGPSKDINKGMLQTSIGSGKCAGWTSVSLTSGGKIGTTFSVSPSGYTSPVYSSQLNIGLGLPAGPFPVNGAAGVSNTWLLSK